MSFERESFTVMKSKVLSSVLVCVASPLFCETYVVTSAPSSVIVYTEGAKVTRNLTVELPVGRHDVILPDLPPELEYQIPQVTVTNAVLGPVSVRKDALPPLSEEETDDVVTAREQLMVAQKSLADHEDQEARVMSAAEAAKLQIEFLKALARNEGLSSDAGDLNEVAVMVGEQTQSARLQILDAEKTVRGMRETRESLEQALEEAEEALAALLTSDEDRFQAAITLSTDTAATAELSVSYFVSASWEPLYDVTLSTAKTAQIGIRRGAAIEQSSGEDWNDVEVRLSTLTVSEKLKPSSVFPRKLVAVDPAPPLQSLDRGSVQLAEPIVEAPVIVEEAAAATYDGPGVTYDVPARITVANDVDAARIALDTITLPAVVFARAVPLRDETAYLMARFKNTTDEPFLSSNETLFSVENQFVGLSDMPEILAGDEGILAFGPIEDLRLDLKVLDRSDGDSGILNRSNVRDEETLITVKNLGDQSYSLELIGQVPYSEQEELQITFTADPEPSEENYDFMRGVLKWDLEVRPNEEIVVSVSQSIRWPEDKSLE
ncbi:DUF4139 domain-containing protein [uncultured Roseobacter sp.]|uniref:DUF4139 domain-containing protein n=1 Tax=uncultured Roseobacter sp. TaxID=114847 RepID=UPI0026326444|nr:DUF4139 domain-containing protein [uncultured Roseobacter sp.]